MRVAGELADIDHLLVDATVDTLDLRLFDYALQNAAPIRLALDQQRRADRRSAAGRRGHAAARRRRRSVCTTNGSRCRPSATRTSASFRASSATCAAPAARELTAAIDGPLHEPVFSGSATITDGRIRHFALPNALEAINGTMRFDARGVRLDDVSATLGGGRVQFGGRIGFDGYLPGELNVTARGEDMQLRYPEGMRSLVDADLSLRGNVEAPTLAGRSRSRARSGRGASIRRGSLLDSPARRRLAGGGAGAAADAAAAVRRPLFAVDAAGRQQPGAAGRQRRPARCAAPTTGRCCSAAPRSTAARSPSRAPLPRHARHDRFHQPDAHRAVLRRRGRDPRARARQTYRVTSRAAGTSEQLQPTFNSDPPLPAADVLALLFSDVRRQRPGRRSCARCRIRTSARRTSCGPRDAGAGRLRLQPRSAASSSRRSASTRSS